jgi:hypothetical protein
MQTIHGSHWPMVSKWLFPAERDGWSRAHLASDYTLLEGFVLRWCNDPAEACTRLKYPQKRRVESYAAQ